MAGRREKLRRVGIIPEYRGFTPDGLASGDAIDMTVDELEVLRLCDLEGLNQEEVAQSMGIARATVAAISSRAHRKVANALVNGRAVVIEGGNIAYSPITTTTAAWPAKEVGTMRVATTYDNGNIFMHFGRSEQFKIYDIQDGKVLNEQVVGTGGTGHGALAGLLANGGVDTLICGGIGGGAQAALAEAGVELCSGAEGDVDAAVEAYLNGTLTSAGATCDHHDHEEGHSCGGHCGSHEEEESSCGGSCGTCGGGCGAPTPVMEGKNVGKTCRTHYRGTFNDGTQFDSSYDRGEPLEFICGVGQMIRGFDAAVAEMEVGEKVNIHLMPEEAYGMPDPNAIFTVAIAQLPGAEEVEVGQQVYLQNQYGQPFPVKVTAKDETNITFDANHEMAGKELNFEIELVEVK